MDKLKEKFKQSFFIVNKLYLFIGLIYLSISDASLALYTFILSISIYIWKILTSKVPMDVEDEFQVETYIYKTTDSKDLKVDIYYPNNPTNNHPLIYFAHGGGWISGFRNQPNNVSWCRYLASKGFAVASIDYRYGFKNDMEDILADYHDGLEFIKSHKDNLNINTEKIILMGLSAGGHLALLYSAYNTFMENHNNLTGIKSIVTYYPPSDLKDLFESDNKSLLVKFAASRTLKGRPSKEEEIYDYYSPINWIGEKMIPVLLVHGKADNTVPFQSSVNLAAKLKKYKIPYTFLIHKKAGHSFDTQLEDYTTINILNKTINFIKKSVKDD